MRRDKGALFGSVVFAVLLALPVIRPGGGFKLFKQRWAPGARPLVHRDLSHIQKDTLRVLVLVDPLSWEPHPGGATGLEWELLERFAHWKNLHITAVPVDHPDTMLMMLQRGEGDVMAAQFCPRSPVAAHVSATMPYRMVAPVRAALNVDALVRATLSSKWKRGATDTLRISCWSPFSGIPGLLDSTLGRVVLVPDTDTDDGLLTRVALGREHAMLSSDAEGRCAAKRLPHLAFAPRLGGSVPLSFAVRSNSPYLLRALNTWLLDEHEREALEELIASYGDAKLTRGPVRTLAAISFGTDSISPFDSLFQLHADSSAFDWKLLAAVAYKESRFDSTVVSSAGASGIMQMMPATAEALGVDTASGVDDHIRAATEYLAVLDTMWRNSVPGKDQRLKFILASYNAGPGHIKDAQRLAGKLGLDIRRWDGSVERALLLLARPRFFMLPEIKNGYCRGHETFWYVRDVVAAFTQFAKEPAR